MEKMPASILGDLGETLLSQGNSLQQGEPALLSKTSQEEYNMTATTAILEPWAFPHETVGIREEFNHEKGLVNARVHEARRSAEQGRPYKSGWLS